MDPLTTFLLVEALNDDDLPPVPSEPMTLGQLAIAIIIIVLVLGGVAVSERVSRKRLQRRSAAERQAVDDLNRELVEQWAAEDAYLDAHPEIDPATVRGRRIRYPPPPEYIWR